MMETLSGFERRHTTLKEGERVGEKDDMTKQMLKQNCSQTLGGGWGLLGPKDTSSGAE